LGAGCDIDIDIGPGRRILGFFLFRRRVQNAQHFIEIQLKSYFNNWSRMVRISVPVRS